MLEILVADAHAANLPTIAIEEPLATPGAATVATVRIGATAVVGGSRGRRCTDQGSRADADRNATTPTAMCFRRLGRRNGRTERQNRSSRKSRKGRLHGVLHLLSAFPGRTRRARVPGRSSRDRLRTP